ncbi:MAG: L-2-hydroxyglutarate oxidase [Verrucomicrobiales bacterium]|nr:L-2-hydroxyglutarate oxidase [Verrucomicrobiales bacterium]MCP5525221.1 L-2-hydroxyglutarate oxidase [Verrucomicrobiales bacterium]
MRSALIIGGGIVGLATAWRLRERHPTARITLLEKERRVGAHQSTHNSGVLHCGLYYQPGSQKARLAVQGIRQMVAFCRSEDVPHDVCGKLVVATREEELPRLDELLRRGQANGLQGLRRLSPAEIRSHEPHAAGLAAARVPEEGIVDYDAVCARLADRLREREGRIELNAAVRRLERRPGAWIAHTTRGPFEADWIVNCAGLHCDRVAALAGEPREVRIIPFRGEYYRLRRERDGLVRHLIYPVPDPKFPFLGVHFTRLIEGGVEAGPNAVLAFAREGYRFSTLNPLDLWDALSFPGLWRFLRRYPDMVRTELAQSLSKSRFCRALQRLVPDIRPADLDAGGAGVRAQAMAPEGTLVQDFHILARDQALHVLNAPSPAATASLAIGEHIAGLIPS